MTRYNFGDVILINFPFTNLQTSKQRPAVIVSSEMYQESRPDIILMAITSQIRKPLSTGEAIVEDWERTGLIKPSVFKPIIATIEKDKIIRKLGQLSSNDKLRLNEIIQTILGTD